MYIYVVLIILYICIHNLWNGENSTSLSPGTRYSLKTNAYAVAPGATYFYIFTLHQWKGLIIHTTNMYIGHFSKHNNGLLYNSITYIYIISIYIYLCLYVYKQPAYWFSNITIACGRYLAYIRTFHIYTGVGAYFTHILNLNYNECRWTLFFFFFWLCFI